jgi:hypothetical protein
LKVLEGKRRGEEGSREEEVREVREVDVREQTCVAALWQHFHTHHKFEPLPGFCLDRLFLAKSSSIHQFPCILNQIKS